MRTTRLAALCAVLVVALVAADRGRFGRFNSRCDQGRSSRGFLCDASSSVAAYFEFAPASGAGMGAACAGTAVTGSRGETVTVARGSAAECYSNDGQTLTQIASNLPRVSSGDITSTWLGIWSERPVTNLALRSRDLSVAGVWVPTSMTCTLTATGMRNDVNGASTCTATGANGTALQTLTVAAATRSTSLHLKRRTGTGTVEVTRNNGTTWSAVDASLSSTVWRRVVSVETAGCAGGNCIVVPAMTASVLNPVIGIRIVTSGDAVDVDFVQDENSPEPTSPILTTSASATRSGDLYTVTTATPAPAFCGAVTVVTGRTVPNTSSLLTFQSGGTYSFSLQTDSLSRATWYNGAVYSPAVSSTASTPGTFRLLGSHSGTTDRACMLGNCVSAANATALVTRTTVVLCGDSAFPTVAPPNGVCRGFQFDSDTTRCTP